MRTRSITVLLAGLALPACSDPASGGAMATDPRSWPEGTVLAVEDVPILASDVDRDSTLIYHLALESTERDLRRKALANLTLPRTIARVLAGDERERVERRAREELAELVSGERPIPPDAQRVEGGYGDLGYALWGTAIETPIGSWTPLIEIDGAFVAAYVHNLFEYEIPAGTEADVEVVGWPYLAGFGSGVVDAAMDELQLTIVDPEWRRIVPEITQYRMGVHEP